MHSHPQWWHGPSWLAHESSSWPISAFDIHAPCTYPDLEQERRKQIQTSLIVASSTPSYVENYSSLTRLIRVFAYCRRFIRNSRLPVVDRGTSFLSAQELHNTLLFFVRQSQRLHFGIEVKELEAHRCIPRSSKILSLNPFLDDTGILRVGGRLQLSQLNYATKHQIILHPHSHLTELIIEYEHIRLLHSGVQSTQSSLRQKYWIINDKSYIRSVIHKCIICFRYRARGANQLLGQLPPSRVTPAKPFSQAAVDYAGPVLLRHGGQRSESTSKAYIALFICMSTKAIHLELVSDLTSNLSLIHI